MNFYLLHIIQLLNVLFIICVMTMVVLQGYDLLWRGVEITTGAQREHRYEEIIKNAKEKGLEKDVEFLS